MSSPRKNRRLQVKPLQGRFFDMKPSRKPQPKLNKSPSRNLFLAIVLMIFGGLVGYRFWMTSQELLEENKEIASQGVGQLEQAAYATQIQDLAQAQEAFALAQVNFEALSENLNELIPKFNEQGQRRTAIGSVQTLAQWSVEVSELGGELTLWAEKNTQTQPAFESVFSGGESELFNQFQEARDEFDLHLNKARELDETLQGLNVPFLENELAQAKAQFSALMVVMEKMNTAFEGLSVLLGENEPHTYLVLFQNSNERRATGGFIGSVASVTVDQGRVSQIEPFDIYAIDRLMEEEIPSPPGIVDLSPNFYSRDANYWPDFPTSAKMILDLMQKSGTPAFDTVVAIDQTVAETVLNYTPPLYTDDGVFEINGETFTPLIQFYTEAKLSEGRNPKGFLFTLIDPLKEGLVQLEDKKALTDDLLVLSKKGHFQFYSRRPEAQMIFDELDLSGRLLPPAEGQDFLAVITTSVGANKSDRYMNMALEHTTQIGEGGELTNQLTVKKRHTWAAENWNEFEPYVSHYGTGKSDLESLRYILGEGGHIDYLRVYVPKGSILREVSGIEMESINITEESGYTVFAFRFGPVSPGKIEEFTLVYDLPFGLKGIPAEYTFVAQPQAAAKNIFLKKQFQVGGEWQVLGGRSNGEPVLSQTPILDELFERDEWYEVDLIGQ